MDTFLSLHAFAMSNAPKIYVSKIIFRMFSWISKFPETSLKSTYIMFDSIVEEESLDLLMSDFIRYALLILLLGQYLIFNIHFPCS